jgi:DAK2 domain fusion protein YloV
VTLTVSSALVLDWLDRARAALAGERAQIDALNVFPVPDGDTGTNLYLTVESASLAASQACGAGTGTTAEAARAAATGALLGARGNSGVILAQMLRGVGEVLGTLAEGDVLEVDSVRAMLRRAADLAYESVSRPVEGTMLTVARAAADAADAVTHAGVAATVVAAAEGARVALARTPDQLEALRMAGVVDAGGRGVVVVLEALAGLASGAPAPIEPADASAAARAAATAESRSYGGPAYEVMFLLDADDGAVASLRAQLDTLGDSLVVVGGDRLWNVHVHVDDAGAAIEAALAVGRPYRLRITYLEPVRPGRGRALVAVAHGPGVADLLRQCDVEVVPAAPAHRPSTAELLDAIRLTHAAEVAVLPSDSDTRAVAEQAAAAAREEGVRVSVIPTRAVVQTLAAVAVHDADAAFDEDVVAMTRAAGATRYAAVTVASRAALTTVGPCEPGDVLGLVDGDIVAVGDDLATVARDLLARMLAVGGELVTLVPGIEATSDLREDLVEWVERTYPLVEVVAYDGGQPLWPLILGVE